MKESLATEPARSWQRPYRRDTLPTCSRIYTTDHPIFPTREKVLNLFAREIHPLSGVWEGTMLIPTGTLPNHPVYSPSSTTTWLSCPMLLEPAVTAVADHLAAPSRSCRRTKEGSRAPDDGRRLC